MAAKTLPGEWARSTTRWWTAPSPPWNAPASNPRRTPRATVTCIPSSPRSGVRPASSARQSDQIVLRWLPLMIKPSLRQDSVFQGSHRRTARAAMSSSRLPLV